MTTQKIKVIRDWKQQEFENSVNDFCATHNVFATQTNVVEEEGSISYFAILFYREAN